MTLANQQVSVNIVGTLTSAHGLVTPGAALSQTFADSLASATAYFTLQSALASTSDLIDLRGSRIDDLGNPISFSVVHLVFFKNNGEVGVDGQMKLGRNNNHLAFIGQAVQSFINLNPQSSFLWVDSSGISVVAGSSDLIEINGMAGDPYQLIIFGIRTP